MLRADHKRIITIAVAICVLACLAGSTAAAPPAAAKLTILYTNDIHGHLFPFDCDDLGRPLTNIGGAARRAALIRKLKVEAGNPVLVMDAGDVFTRGPLSSLAGAPDFAVMNAVPYDVMTLGNNEFKALPGPEALQVIRDRIAGAKFAVVSANVFDLAAKKRLVAAYKVFDLGGVKAAVFGLTTRSDASKPQFGGLRVDDPIVAARLLVPQLRREADFVIALTHIGVARDLELAASVSGIDVIIGGDSHTWLDQPLLVRWKEPGSRWAIGGTLICQDGEWGRTVGRLDLTLRRLDESGCSVTAYSGRLVDVDSSVAPASDVSAIVQKAAAPFNIEVGRLAAEVKAADAANWVAARMLEASRSQAAVEPREDVEQGLAAGKVTLLDIRSMFPFVNQVASITITGKQLRSFVIDHPDAGLAGARLVEGDLYIGNDKVRDAQVYTVAVEDCYAKRDPALIASPCVSLGKTTVDLVRQHIASGK